MTRKLLLLPDVLHASLEKIVGTYSETPVPRL